MDQRLAYTQASPSAFNAMLQLQRCVENCGLAHPLMELVKMRVSQMNGCAYCLDMHSKDARAAGETEQRLYALNAWRETPFFTDRERAALAWAESLTRIRHGVSDELYSEVRANFGDKEIMDLTLCVIEINGWNRIAIPFRASVGTYHPAGRDKID
jgi:AhpD family alkylhydroperoxidase